ncbi:MAG: VCBS repeat-containing protein, partial [Saprospiraceae bacterium]
MTNVTIPYPRSDISNLMSIRNLTTFMVTYLFVFIACSRQETSSPSETFQILSKDRTGIEFNNQLKESDSLNILQYLYYYNGGGVAIGDINNDDLPDIYFSGNQVNNKLYVNLGNMKFKDVTKKAGVVCSGTWNTGVSMVDINGDGLLDIYVCQVDRMGPKKGSNKLFINNGNLTFTESAAAYGLDFTGLATHAAFLDYDRDGDLDCYLLNHSLKDPEQFKPAAVTRQVSDGVSGDRLLQNQNGIFTDVSSNAGISSSSIGFGLGIDVGDLNRDGWPDIYIGNDFHENDYLYLNNRNGTFREIISTATGHTSNFTMGVAIADINNDARPDILSLDMKPEDEITYKLSGGWESFNMYQFKRSFGYHHQSPRNALQINQGVFNDNPVFSELACQFGIEATDWSWSPLIADFSTDGHKDIFISNGIQRRPNDIDFVNYYSGAGNANKDVGLKLINRMPLGGVSNYMWSNHPETKSFERIPIQDIGSQI